MADTDLPTADQDEPDDASHLDTPNSAAFRRPELDKPALDRCVECGKTIAIDTPHGVCADCSLRNLLNNSYQQTTDYGSQPLLDHPDHDVTVDSQGHVALVDPLKTGDHIGEFQIVRRLGRGGMGTVYEAQDTQNQRRIALKVLNRPVEDAAARQRFLREGRLAASINHPNSVFVYGTHQVDRHSLISMELVGGGTLEQRIRSGGPLPTRDAVDVALQIINGLQAAYDRGILHRDIKPANCFEASDGTIKIGDFGLSISTDPDFDAHVTSEGTMLGTPAFSSPEQLRGDALDVRSDLYALGVTLYYLLTGQTPYRADSLVKLLSQVFESTPKSPRDLRPEIPQELSLIVMRCLAKEPGDRYRNYAELRTALLPLSSQVPEPASLGWRTVAGVLDWAVMGSAGLVYAAITSFSPEPIFDTSYVAAQSSALLFTAIYILYYAVGDSVFGKTLGKAMLGLSTAQADGGRPTFRQAFLRGAMYVLFPILIVLPYNLLFRVGVDPARQVWGWGLVAILLVGASHWMLLGLLFSTARRRNGMAGLHDLASKTRVVSRVAESPSVQVVTETIPKPNETVVGTIGPYQLLQSLHTSEGANDNAEMHVAYDPVLLRRVWLRCESQRADGTSRNRPSRATRLRWLNKFEDQSKIWDVYEAPTGGPLLNRLASEQSSTDQTLPWIADLTTEMQAGLADDTVPQSLGPEQLWLTDSSRLKVLDFSAPGLRHTEASEHNAEPLDEGTDADPGQRCRSLLRTTAPSVRSSLLPKKSAQSPPLYVTKMLSDWEGQSDLESTLVQTSNVARRRPMSPRKRRLLMTAACYALPIAQIIFMVASQLQSGIFFAKNPDLRQLHALLNIVQENRGARNASQLEDIIAKQPELESRLGPEVQKFHLYNAAANMIAGQHAGVLDDPRMQQFAAMMHFHPQLRQQTSEFQSTLDPTEAELDAASEILEEPLRQRAGNFPAGLFGGYGNALMFSVTTWLFYVVFPAALAGLLFRGGLIIHGFQTAIVRIKDGKPAGRVRIMLRSLLAMIPGFAAFSVLAIRQVPLASVDPLYMHPATSTVVVSLAIALAIVSNFFGTRSLADRILRTAVVAR